MKFTREYRFSPAIIIGRTSATVGLFLGYRSGIHKLFAIRARRLCYRIAYHPSVKVDDGRSSATVDFGVRCTPNEQHQGLWTCVTQFYSGSISENVLKTEKKMSNETLFSQPIFVVLGRELLAKFSIVTKIFKILRSKNWRRR